MRREQPLTEYVARLSERDHFNSKGVDLRRVPKIQLADILLQDRINVHKLGRADFEDARDAAYRALGHKPYCRLFEGTNVQVVPPAQAVTILQGTPLVRASVRAKEITVVVLADRAAPPVPVPVATPIPMVPPTQKPLFGLWSGRLD
jgi:hypothetical protein